MLLWFQCNDKILVVFKLNTKCSPGPKWQKSTVFRYTGDVEGLGQKMHPLFRLSFQNFYHVLLPKDCIFEEP